MQPFSYLHFHRALIRGEIKHVPRQPSNVFHTYWRNRAFRDLLSSHAWRRFHRSCAPLVDSYFPEEFFGGQRAVGRWGKMDFLVACPHSKMAEAPKKFWLASLNVSCSEGPWVRQRLASGRWWSLRRVGRARSGDSEMEGSF